jgi:hypothetical protein
MTATTIRSAVVGAEPPKTVDRRATRGLGAAVGVAVAAAPAVAAYAYADTAFLAAGIPGALLVGALLGPRIRGDGPIAGVVVAMATLAIVVADAVVCTWAIIEPGLERLGGTDVATLIVGGIYIGAAGLVIVGVPMLLVTLPCAFVWALVVRELVRRGRGVTRG